MRRKRRLLAGLCLCLGLGLGTAQVSAGAPAPGVGLEGERAARLIEEQMPFYAFVPMPAETLAAATSALGDAIAQSYSWTGRVTAEGAFGYIVGVQTAAQSPLEGAYASVTSDSGTLTTEIVRYGAEKQQTEEVLCAFTGATLCYNAESPQIVALLPENDGQADLNAALNLLIAGAFDDLADLSRRGVSVAVPPVPYLQVRRYDDGAYRCEYIALTEQEVMNARCSSKLYGAEELGDDAIRLVTAARPEGENAGIPAPLFELAQEKCGFAVASPSDIGNVVSAEMVLQGREGKRTQQVTDADALKTLTALFKRAQPVGLGKCPYTGVLTLTMDDGRSITVHKAVDSCGTMVFGSMKCYRFSRADNEAFWQLFDEIAAMRP